MTAPHEWDGWDGVSDPEEATGTGPDPATGPAPDPGPGTDQAPDLPDLGELAAALPGLARIAANSWLNTTKWGLGTTWRLTRRLAAAARDPELAQELAQELGVAVGTVTELARAVGAGAPLNEAVIDVGTKLAPLVRDEPVREEPTDLRARGEELLKRSRDVWREEEAHPAYDRILSELAPDEARILLLLQRSGPQPSVDVRTGGPVGMVSSRLIAPGLNMIAARAGVRYSDQVPSYLNNLFRLGLIWFSREQLHESAPYQVLEAQPDVLTAMHSVGFAKVVRRSIHLTSFGQDFCRATLTDEQGPEHAEPPVDDERGATS